MLEFIIVLVIFYKFYEKFANDANHRNTQNTKYPPKQTYNYPAPVQQPKATDDHCIIAPSTDPIQDGSKANSILGAFFGNKVEKL